MQLSALELLGVWGSKLNRGERSQLQRRRLHREDFNPRKDSPATQVNQNVNFPGVDTHSSAVYVQSVTILHGRNDEREPHKSCFSNCSQSLQPSLMNDRSLVPSSPARATHITVTLLGSCREKMRCMKRAVVVLPWKPVALTYATRSCSPLPPSLLSCRGTGGNGRT